MLLFFHPRSVRQLIRYHQNTAVRAIAFNSTSESCVSLENEREIDRIAKIISDHPFPDVPLQPTLLHHIPPSNLSAKFVENVLGRLFAANTNGVKAFEFFKFTLHYSNVSLTSDAIEKTLHILTRMRYFDKAWEVMEEIIEIDPSLLTLKSMSIVLSKIAKFQTYEETLAAFERMEKHIFVGRNFGIDEFNVLLRVFCTQRQMKEAKSIFNKMYSRFPTNTKTMNILLLGFKETGDITSVELFYHEMVKRGFKPNGITYNIRIDAYCKRGCLDDGLRLFQEMEHSNCSPTLETVTTLIHGAGVARNVTRAWELFNELPTRKLCPDAGAYNAMISVLVKCRQVEYAINLVNEMEEKHISPDGITYHTMFHGLMKSNGIEAVRGFYEKMVMQNFVPETRTVVMLMKFFCGNRYLDLGLNLWGYLLEKGSCPHDHALALLVTSLCSHGRVQEAFDCAKQMLNRGRHMGKPVFHMLERFLREAGEIEKLKNLDEMIRKLGTAYPPSRGHALGLSTPFC
ncbi:hypothetical protein SOVF_034390 [Spinacia oleracea]|uniref:Pentatricopeptide repeat-containing protein At3g61360 n=1 Tax=Spinacia oleracea TaxID=3562 RepID=A0A9R0J3X8_SPIOL|nr:pentatricopeptide repeat-containing protein At3g61360 [Spinacia oleracea]KNA22390.1 hypothetical protein SOVF_034390 [Spinacia oleracea]